MDTKNPISSAEININNASTILFQRRPAESSKKYKKLPPQSDSLEESSQVFANDWKPLLNGNKANYYYPLVRSAARPSKSTPHSVAPVKEIKDGASNRLKPTPKPLPIHEAVDITTVFPPKKASLSPSVYKNNLKRINHMNYFNYKLMQTGGDSNTPAESKLKENFDLPRRRPVKKQVQPKKVDGGYQVHEDVEGDTKPPKYTSFNALSPSLMKSVPLYPAFEDNQIIDRAKENKTVTANVGTFGKRTKPRRNNKSSSQ